MHIELHNFKNNLFCPRSLRILRLLGDLLVFRCVNPPLPLLLNILTQSRSVRHNCSVSRIVRFLFIVLTEYLFVAVSITIQNLIIAIVIANINKVEYTYNISNSYRVSHFHCRTKRYQL